MKSPHSMEIVELIEKSNLSYKNGGWYWVRYKQDRSVGKHIIYISDTELRLYNFILKSHLTKTETKYLESIIDNLNSEAINEFDYD